MTYFIIALFIVLIFAIWSNTEQKKVTSIISHWSHLIQNIQISSQEFYVFLEKAINDRQLPNTKISRVSFYEGGVQSAKREYMRIIRYDHIFDICAAPFGTCFFFSWWLGDSVGLLYRITARIPFIGPVLIRIFSPETYYNIDTMIMFQEAVHLSMIEVVNAYLQSKGMRVLSESERKPIMHKIMK